jgi:hypothetical protein
MKKKIFLLPILLLASLILFNWGCGEEDKDTSEENAKPLNKEFLRDVIFLQLAVQKMEEAAIM